MYFENNVGATAAILRGSAVYILLTWGFRLTEQAPWRYHDQFGGHGSHDTE
jgi:hypothetical protein